jgi:hypothetical protein
MGVSRPKRGRNFNKATRTRTSKRENCPAAVQRLPESAKVCRPEARNARSPWKKRTSSFHLARVFLFIDNSSAFIEVVTFTLDIGTLMARLVRKCTCAHVWRLTSRVFATQPGRLPGLLGEELHYGRSDCVSLHLASFRFNRHSIPRRLSSFGVRFRFAKWRISAISSRFAEEFWRACALFSRYVSTISRATR